MLLRYSSEILGTILFIFCFSSLLLNATVLFVLKKAGFISSVHSSVYILAFYNITGNSLLMLLYCCYLSPAAILQDYLFESGERSFGVKLMGFFFHCLWLQDLFTQVITSLNRIVMVIYPKAAIIFSRQNTFIFGTAAFLAALVIAFISNFLMPCCGFYLSYKRFSYAYFENGINYANFYIALPLNISCSVICVTCYITIYLYVRRSNKNCINVVEKSIYQMRKAKELRYAMQFSMCTVACIFIWISYRIGSAIFPEADDPLFFILTILHIFHCSANSLIFIFYNTDTKREYKNIILGFRKFKNGPSTAAATIFPSTLQTSKVTIIAVSK